jgi:hypothetical protein
MLVTPTTADFAVNQPIEYTVVREQVPPDPPQVYHFNVFDLRTNLLVPNVGADVDLSWVTHATVRLGPLAPSDYEFQITGATVPFTMTVPFTVGTPPVTRVELVRNAPLGAAQLGDVCPTYAGFIAFLQTTVPGQQQPPLDPQEQVNVGVPPRAAPTPPFGLGPGTYDQLIQLARDYVQTCNCNDLRDLAPGGYLDNRRAAETHWAPPPDDGPSLDMPCLELIWNYWEEEGMLAQTLNHIVARFQNRRVSAGDPLARFDVSPLIPLRSLLWAWADNEHRRLTVRRRATEYEFEYGLRLIGKAVPSREALVERRSKFLQAFHTILNLSADLFKQIDTLIVNPDAHPLYEALREGHLVLSQGTENQYGEMAVTARAEMLVMQHILAQPSMREFLGGRPMTPYPEPWMDRVDSMKAIQGWSDASVFHYHDLATFGERLVVTIRLGNWAALNVGAAQAQNWAAGFRPLIQRYIAAYRAVTGVDLAADVDTTMPSTLIASRMDQSLRRA